MKYKNNNNEPLKSSPFLTLGYVVNQSAQVEPIAFKPMQEKRKETVKNYIAENEMRINRQFKRQYPNLINLILFGQNK